MVGRGTKVAAALVVILILAGVAYFAFAGGNQTQTTRSSTAIGSASSSSSSLGTTVQTTTLVTSSTFSSTVLSSTSALVNNANWTSYHKDNTRSGLEQMGNISTVRQGWVYPGLDGKVYAEPLVVEGSVFVATENDSVYAFSVQDGSLIWRTHLGDPIPGGSLPCGDIDPSGITGTPVVDNSTETLYVVAFSNPAHHTMFGLDLDTGTVVSQASVDPPGADPTVEQQRGALALSRGVVYIPYGGLYGDCGNYHGWVVGAYVNGSQGILSYEVPTHREGGIWAPAGLTVSSAGDVYVATGNGDSTSSFDYGESVIELSPSLGLLDYFAPTNWAQLNGADTDLGSVAPTLLANGNLFQAGKEGVGYLLSGSSLGGIGGQVYSAKVCSAVYGGTALVGQTVFVPCTDGLTEVVVGASNFTLGWRALGFFAGPPIVTGNVVWSVDLDNGTLLGYALGTGAQRFSFSLGSVVHFCTPAAGDEMMFVAGGTELYSFTLEASS